MEDEQKKPGSGRGKKPFRARRPRAAQGRETQHFGMSDAGTKENVKAARPVNSGKRTGKQPARGTNTHREDASEKKRIRRIAGNTQRPVKAVKTKKILETGRPEVLSDENSGYIEGRNAVIEALRAGRTIERLYILDGCMDGPVQTIKREAAKRDIPVRFVSRDRLDEMSEAGHHQGVIATAAAYHYAELEDLFKKAEEKGEDPFFLLLDNIEDPHNLGAIIRTANTVGAHGVIIPKDRAVGLTATVAKASAGALNYTPVVKVTNLAATIDELKQRGLWFVCADMDGTPMTKLNLCGAIGLVIGAEGAGVSKLVKEKCDMVASIPMRGEINSLNASVAAGVLAYEVLRQRIS